MTDDKKLLESLARAEAANMHAGNCQVCIAMAQMSEEARDGVEQALSGTIGERRLAEILSAFGYKVGRRAVIWHRSGHTKHKQ